MFLAPMSGSILAPVSCNDQGGVRRLGIADGNNSYGTERPQEIFQRGEVTTPYQARFKEGTAKLLSRKSFDGILYKRILCYVFVVGPAISAILVSGFIGSLDDLIDTARSRMIHPHTLARCS